MPARKSRLSDGLVDLRRFPDLHVEDVVLDCVFHQLDDFHVLHLADPEETTECLRG